MSAVRIAGAVLTADVPLTAVVPAASMRGGLLPPEIAVPRITVTLISGGFLEVLSKGTRRHGSARVQVTVQAQTYDQLDLIMPLVRNACDGQRGTIAGFGQVSITIGPEGPDFFLEGPDIWARSQDLFVSFNELT